MNIIQDTNLGLQQLTLDFERPAYEQKLQKVLSVIDSKIAENDRVILDELVMHFSMAPDKWAEKHIHDMVLDLFKEDKVHFRIDGRTILPRNITSHPIETHPGSQFLEKREIFSMVKRHLSDPALWKSIEITKPEVVEEPVLLKAHQLRKKLFKEVGFLSQNSLCRSLRGHFRRWKNNLTEFWSVAETDNYPGKNEIIEVLDLIEKLLSIHDPGEFIRTFNGMEDQLCNASCHFDILQDFYTHRIHIWDALIQAVETFMPNRTDLEKNPDVKRALETLCEILDDPKPYGGIKEIEKLISIVKPANDRIVEEQITSAKTLAIQKIEKKIDIIKKVLEKKNASSDIRNKSLFPLQAGKKKINAASNLKSIADDLNDAIDQFESAMELLD